MPARSTTGAARPRFARQNHFPQGWQICVEQFVQLFHRFGYIYKPLSGGSWYSANEKWKLPDSEILKAIACAHPKFFIGCRAGKATRFAVLDIDKDSKYHNQQSFDRLLQVLSQAGLSRSSLYRSSHSGGWHLYIFFDEPINSVDLRRQLFKLLTLNDFQVAKGQLELFPCPGDQGSQGLGLRLPLQPGFAWLDKKTLEVERERHDLDATQALELFVDALDGDANSYLAFRQLKPYLQELEQRKQAAVACVQGEPQSNVVPFRKTDKQLQPSEYAQFVRAVFHQLPPGIIVDNWYKGRIYALNGLTGPSQRAEAIECFGHYLFYGDPSRDLPAMGYGYEQEREWAIRELLEARNNGQSKDLNRGRADALAQVERAANWRPAHKRTDAPQKYSPKRPVSWIRENLNRSNNARKRIKEALDKLVVHRRPFTTVDLQQAAKCSRQTLYNHADIWRKDYEDLAAGFFAFCTDEYNVVVGAASEESQPPSSPSNSDMPPGRLAARRIAYEISMRQEKEEQKASKAAQRSLEESERSWQGEVTRLTKNDPSTLSVYEIKALLSVLSTYLAIAPSYEDQEGLKHYVSLLHRELQIATQGPERNVGPP